MPMFGIGLHVLVAVLFAIHAVRNNQPLYWLFILFFFPLLGSIVYGVAVWLPEMRSHRGVRRAGSKVKQLLDPGRELRGLYAGDPDIQSRLAKALLESGRPADARELLDRVIAENPKFKSPPAHLTYARAVAACGDREKAHEEYGVLTGYYPGLEARARYAALLQEWGDTAGAQKLAAESLRDSQRLPAHTRGNEREWIAMLQKIDRG